MFFSMKKKGKSKKRNKRNKSYKKQKFKVFNITPKLKRKKFKINFKSIKHKNTRNFTEVAFIKDLLLKLSNV